MGGNTTTCVIQNREATIGLKYLVFTKDATSNDDETIGISTLILSSFKISRTEMFCTFSFDLLNLP